MFRRMFQEKNCQSETSAASGISKGAVSSQSVTVMISVPPDSAWLSRRGEGVLQLQYLMGRFVYPDADADGSQPAGISGGFDIGFSI